MKASRVLEILARAAWKSLSKPAAPPSLAPAQLAPAQLASRGLRASWPFDAFAAPIVGGVFVALFFLQARHALRRQRHSTTRRAARNLLFAVPSLLVMRGLMLPVPLGVALWAKQRRFGLLNWLPLPRPLQVLGGVLLFDYAYYWWHIATHRAPILWRFHQVHHTDLDMDHTTATRFHFAELGVSVFWRGAFVGLAGLSPISVLLYEALFQSAGQFHHSNWKLPIRVERALSKVIQTPRLHGVHHSIVQRETNSNWGTVFVFWDKMHHTLRQDVAQDDITIGVPAFRDESELKVLDLFLLPFRPLRPWQTPHGERPQREERPADELEP